MSLVAAALIATLFIPLCASTALAAGSVSGQITSSVTHVGIAGAKVQFYNLNSNDDPITATADNSGNYSQNLLDGSYAVLTQNAQGYINKVWNNVSCSAVCDVNSITPVVVSGGVVTDINFALDPGGARISGTITSSVTGNPIVGALVYFIDSGQNVPFSTATTDGTGHYISDGGSVSGNVFVQTQNLQGYQDEGYDNHKCSLDGGCHGSAMDPVPVTLGLTTNNINFALDPGGRISGSVKDANNSPVANVEVRTYDSNDNRVDSVVTDASGNFITSGLPTGTYYVATRNSSGLADYLWNGLLCAHNFCGNETQGTPISVTLPSTTGGINFVLPPGQTVSGTVTAAAGNAPLSNVFVGLNNASGAFVAGANTDAAGHFATGAVPAGTYYANTFINGYTSQLYNHISCSNCSPTNGTPIVVSNHPVTNIDFSLLATGTGTITGTVTDGSNSSFLNGVSVQLFSPSGGFVTSANTNASGLFTFSNVNAGSYYVRTNVGLLPNGTAFINQLHPGITCVTCNVLTTAGGTLVTVSNGVTTTGINFTLQRGPVITGTISSIVVGPLSGVGAQVFNSAGVSVGTFTTNASGVYSTNGLPPDTYYVRTTNTRTYIGQLWQGHSCPQTGCIVTSGTPIPVNGTTVSGIDFALATGGQISGKVTDASNSQGLANVGAQIFSSSGVILGTANTDSSGNYVTAGLPAGTYYVRTGSGALFVNNQQLGFVDQLWNGTACVPYCSNPTAGTAVPVTTLNVTTGINFALSRGGSISGAVIDANTGVGLASIGVQIFTAAGVLAKVTTTNTGGGYTAAGLPTGNYFARTSVPAGVAYQDKVYAGVSCGTGCATTTGTPIAVLSGVTSNGVDFALSTGGGGISGTVTDGTGAPLPGVLVQIYSGSGTFTKFANTNLAGMYATSGLAPGTYYARTVQSVPTGFPEQLYNRKQCDSTCTVTNGTPILVSAGATTPAIDFALANYTPPIATPSSLHFGATKAGAAGALTSVTPPQNVTVTFAGGPSAWTASADQPWVQITGGSGGGPGHFTVSIVNRNNVVGASTSLSATITVTSAVSGLATAAVSVQLAVQQGATGTAPFGVFDTPTDGAAGVTGSIAVTGWALDAVGVSGVAIYRNCLVRIDNPANCKTVSGYNVVFIGDAAFVAGARPDIEALYPTDPFANRAGWGYLMLTNMLPHVTAPSNAGGGGQGPLTIYAFATNVEGFTALLGQKSIALDNDHGAKPFGAIDTPSQGGTVSGTIANYGWALTPGAAMIPIDGSTMTVVVDGVALGTVSYNLCRDGASPPAGPGGCRDDVATLFPTLTNITNAIGAIGVFNIDTTKLADGVHTIAWGVTDNQNRTDGLGSRYFSVLNGAPSLTASGTSLRTSTTTSSSGQSSLQDALAAPLESLGGEAKLAWRSVSDASIDGRAGFDFDAPLEDIPADTAGVRHVRLPELGRIELRLGHDTTTGYLRANGTLRPLPAGSQLDTATGVFTWAPGAGFIGTYDLVFLNGMTQLPVEVTIESKSGDTAARMRGWIDLPRTNAIVARAFTVAGWAIDTSAWQGAGVGAVHVWAKRRDVPAGAEVFLGAAALGGARSDVAVVYGAQFERAGWSLNASVLAPGTYDVTAYFWSTRTGQFEDARTVSITVR